MFCNNITIFTVAVALCCSPLAAFTVFDCDAGSSTTRTIDLREPSLCKDPHTDFAEPTVQKVQIAQVGTTTPLIGYQCRATVTKQVTRCGIDSITYGSSYPVFQRPWPIAPNQCREAVKSNSLTIERRTFSISIGQPTTIQEYTHGSVDAQGSCITENFETEGVLHYNSFEQTTTTIHVLAINGIIDAADDSVTFANGIRANANDLVLHDAYEGTIVWSKTELNCSDSISSLYVGNATLHRPRGEETSHQGSIVLLEHPKVQQYAGLKLTSPRTLCAIQCYGTNIKGIVICLLRDHDEPYFSNSFRDWEPQQQIDFQSQIGFLHLKTNLDVHARFAAILGNLCKLERATLHLKLQAIAGANNPYSLLDLYGPGHVYYRAGAVVYINKCSAVDATLTDHRNCTTEIPVLINGTKRFADPLSWVLRDYPQELPCTNIMPIRWKIADVWYCATPAALPCEAPDQLEVAKPLFNTPDFTAGLVGGIYTESQRIQHQHFIRSSSGREAVVSKIATAAVMNAGLPGVLGLPLTTLDLDMLVDELGYTFVPFFSLIGHAYVTIVGIIVVMAFVKHFVNCLIRGYMLVNQRGWGIYLFAAGWDTLFHVFHMPHAAFWNAMHPQDQELEEAPLAGGAVELVEPPPPVVQPGQNPLYPGI